MAGDALAGVIRFFSDLGHDIVSELGDATSRDALMARAGVVAPANAPLTDPSSAAKFDSLSAKSKTDGADSFALLIELSEAMIDLVTIVQQATSLNNADDVWNLIATFIDLISVDRLRSKNPEVVAILNAMHLLSNDRLLIADLIRSGDQWGQFVLGHPAAEDAQADNWSLILGAALVVLAKWVPLEDEAGTAWLVDVLFGWDPDPSTPQPHLAHVLQRMATFRLTHLDAVGGVPIEEHIGLSAVVVPPGDGGWGMFLALDLGAGVHFPLGQHLELVLEADSPDAIEVFFGDPPFVRAGLQHTTAKLLLRRKQEVADHWNIGADDKLHLEIGTFSTGFQFGDPVSFQLAIGDGALVIPKASMGFLGTVMPSGGIKFNFDVTLIVDTKGNLSFQGGAGMTVVLPVNVSLSVFRVRSITLALMIEGTDHGAGASLAATVAFGLDFAGAFKVAVDGIGAKLVWALPSSPTPVGSGVPVVHGNLGPAGDVSLDFVPPKGIGVAIDVGPIKGGGFFYFDPPHRTYGGVLEASLALCGKGISIKAAGLFRETDDGYDFVLILSAQIEPAIEIFLGLTLNGVGGMLGINVAVDVDKLRSGLHDGAVGRLLFPDDPVGNAPAIIATMGSVFPHHKDGYVAGPMVQLGWGRPNSFVTLSVAIVVAFPQPTLLLIMGRLRLVAPVAELAIVDIKVDFLGVIDFQEPSFSFDASLVDSKVATFPLTGDMIVRAGKPGFILSIGGFHPQFTPPAGLPTLRRISLDISPTPLVKIRTEAYLAITSNTFQVGVHASLDIDAGVASLHGWLDFDALIQWEPKFHFSIHIGIGLELRAGGESFAGISVDLLLEGPGPWHAKGDASLHLLFFTIHAGFEVTWGEDDSVEQPPQIDASLRVSDALNEAGAWSAIAPDGDSWITFRAVQRDDVPLHPYGQLSVRQQAVPIGIPITRVGRSPVVGGTATVQLAPSNGALPSTASTGQFAASQFMDLSDDERLSRPSFESYQDGLIFGSTQIVTSKEQPTTASYETVFIPDTGGRRLRVTMDAKLFGHGLSAGSVARSGLHFATLNDGPAQPVTVAQPSFRVVASDTLATVAQAAQPFASAAAAFEAARSLGGDLLVVGAHEAVS